MSLKKQKKTLERKLPKHQRNQAVVSVDKEAMIQQTLANMKKFEALKALKISIVELRIETLVAARNATVVADEAVEIAYEESNEGQMEDRDMHGVFHPRKGAR